MQLSCRYFPLLLCFKYDFASVRLWGYQKEVFHVHAFFGRRGSQAAARASAEELSRSEA